MEGATQKPLELILARNLLTSISTAAFLVDEQAHLVFYNESAGAMLGMSFEDSGRMPPDEWTATFGPFGGDGDPVPIEDLPLTIALRDGRPAHSIFNVRSAKGVDHSVEASAFPIVGSDSGSSGAMVFFWPLEDNGAGK